MTTRFTAIVEHGLLRPTEPVALRDGAIVEVILVQPDNGQMPRDPARILAEIAALPMEPGDRMLNGRDQDWVINQR